MTSFGKDGRIIDAVHSASDYTRHLLTPDELQDMTLCKSLLNWWEDKNEEKQRLPTREDFNPADFKNILPNLIILDLIFSDEELVDLVTTLMGTEIVRIYGEKTGKLVSEYDRKYVFHGIISAVRECRQRAEPIGVEAKAISEDMPFMSSFALYCPLSTDHPHIDKMLVHVSFDTNVE